jgi:hypothetical protein
VVDVIDEPVVIVTSQFGSMATAVVGALIRVMNMAHAITLDARLIAFTISRVFLRRIERYCF